MGKGNVNMVVEQISRPAVEEMGLELVDVEFVKEGGRWFLRLFIDKPGGVSVEDCQAVSEKLDAILDAADPAPCAYFLEVSSPGIERKLKRPADFTRFRDQMVKIKTYEPVEGRKQFKAKLKGLESGVVVLEDNGRELRIPLDRVSDARLSVDF